MTNYTEQQMRQGIRRLGSLLPSARAEAAKDGDRIVFESTTSKAQAPYIREDNLFALIVYQAPKGGWHADLLMRDTPPGVSNIIGTQVEEPLATETEAVLFAKKLLIAALTIEKQMAENPIEKVDPVFRLFNTEWPLYPHILRMLPKEFAGYGSEKDAIERIGALLREYFSDGKFSYDRLKKLDKEATIRIAAVLHQASLDGVTRYPPREDRPPPQSGSDRKH
jgi:hypothetical protein